MINVRDFGNPDNPFGEPANELLTWRLIVDPIRSIISAQIKLMSARPADVIVSETSDGIVRTLQFISHAPFSQAHGMYTNGSALTRALGVLERTEVRITLGDSLIDSTVASRWVTMTSPDSAPFAITGISRERADGSFEKWDAMNIRTRFEDGAIRSELWAQPAGMDYTERLPAEGSFNHFAAVNKAILAQVARL